MTSEQVMIWYENVTAYVKDIILPAGEKSRKHTDCVARILQGIYKTLVFIICV
jgi:hypothetical protein